MHYKCTKIMKTIICDIDGTLLNYQHDTIPQAGHTKDYTSLPGAVEKMRIVNGIAIGHAYLHALWLWLPTLLARKKGNTFDMWHYCLN